MSRYSFLFSARWLKYIAMTIVVVIACVFLALWQKDRRAERQHEIDTINANYSSTPVEIAQILPDTSARLAADEEWRQVRLTGQFRPADTVLARNRTVEDKVGFYVVVPFALNTGETIAVVRGWVPEANAVPDPPSGEQTIVARLKIAQDGSKDTNPEGMIKAIDPARIPGMVDAFANVYAEEADVASVPGLTPLPAPDLNPGNHLSYMLQWFAFGIMIIIAVSISARRERKAAAETLSHDAAAAEFVVVDKAALDAGAKLSEPGRRYGRGRLASPSAHGPDEADEDEVLEERFRSS